MQKVTFDAEFEFIQINDDIASLEESVALIPKDGIRLIPKDSRHRLRAFMYDLNWRSFFASLILWVSYLICNAGYSTIGPFFPQEALDKGASSLTIGIIIGSSPLCVAILSPLFGYFLPLMNLSIATCFGMMLVGISFSLLGFVTRLSSPMLFVLVCLALRLMEGVGSAMFTTAMFSTFPKLFPNSVGAMMGAFQIAAGLGYSLGRPLGALLYTYGGYKLPFLFVGVSAIIFSLLCALFVRKSEVRRKKQTFSQTAIYKLSTDLLFIVLALVMVTVYGANSFMAPILQPYLSKQFNLNILQIGIIYFITATAYAVTNFPAGAISDKLKQKSRYLIVLGLIVNASGPLTMGFSGSKEIWVICFSFVLLGFGAASAAVPVYANVITLAERYVNNNGGDRAALAAYISGVLSSVMSLGEFIGPFLGGMLGNFFTFSETSLIIGELVLAEAILVLGASVIDRFTWPST